MDFGFIITYLNRMKQDLQDTINSLEVSGGGSGGGNPTGGTIDVATMNYQTTLLQQWIALTIGSSSAQLLNLVNSELETFNLLGSTFFSAGQINYPNAGNDNIYSLQAASGARLPGVVNPAHLKLCAHFQGTGNLPTGVIAADQPVYNSNNGANGKLTLSSLPAVTPPALLAGGTPAASSAVSSQPASNAFDANQSTFWASVAPNILPTAIGVATATGGTPANAFDGNSATNCEINAVYTQGLGLHSESGGFDNIVDFGAANIQFVRTFNFSGSSPFGASGSISLSLDGTNYTLVYTGSVDAGNKTASTPMLARYMKVHTDPNLIQNGFGGTLTIYKDFGDTNVFYKYDLGSGNSIVGNSYSIAANVSGKQPTSWILQGSNDDTNWTNLDSITDYAGSYPFSGTFSNSTAYRYHRLLITKCTSTFNNNVLIVDVKIWNSATSTPYITSGNPQNISYDCGVAVLGTRYTLNSTQNLPTDWTLQGSNDNTNWTTLDTVAAYAGSFPINNKTFTNTIPYRYWRLVFTGSKFNGDIVTISNFYVDTLPVAPFYDTTNFALGTSSAKLRYNYLSGSGQSVNQLQLGNLDWRFSIFARFDAGFNTNETLFFIAGKQLEIIKTPTGLSVNYSTNGTTFTTVSANFSWSPNTSYWIAVGRTGNTLHLNVNGTDIGTADLTGITLFNTTTNTFGIGADTTGANPLIGNVQEAELFVGECPAFTVPTGLRTSPYIPAVNWVSKVNYIPSSTPSINVMFFLDEATFAAVGGGVPIFGTDWTFYLSVDNGTTFNAVTLNKTSALTTLTNIYTGTLDLTGITNTSQLIYKIVTNSGKVLKWDGVILYWQ